jgi:uncharacterized membrane protein YuzA (DUF378 family)
MKNLDVIAAALLVIGGLNWGMVGSFNFDLVATIFGTSVFGSIVYILVGVSALYQTFQFKSIQRRWSTN